MSRESRTPDQVGDADEPSAGAGCPLGRCGKRAAGTACLHVRGDTDIGGSVGVASTFLGQRGSGCNVVAVDVSRGSWETIDSLTGARSPFSVPLDIRGVMPGATTIALTIGSADAAPAIAVERLVGGSL